MASEKILNAKRETVAEITDKLKNSKALFYLNMLNLQLLICKSYVEN